MFHRPATSQYYAPIVIAQKKIIIYTSGFARKGFVVSVASLIKIL